VRKIIFTLAILGFSFSVIFSQNVITGKIIDASTNQPVFGAAVVNKATGSGVTSDFDGNFSINVGGNPPYQISISILGYKKQELTVNDPKQKLSVKLESDSKVLQSIEISDTRITQKQQEEPLTVESLDIIGIKETPAANFYEGLGNLKGVDLTSASIGFKIINTRGFNSTSPVRSLQVIDGVDNQSPGLNFSLGNFLGASELDIKKVDLIQGASSAFYGPNAFNGVISMETKSPFDFPGLSAQIKVGERAMTETAVRWAQKFQNKDGKDKFAYKVNLFYLTANDWEATNYNPSTESLVGRENPGGYDAVNRYGDEALTGNFDFTSPTGKFFNPGLGIIYRDGYNEEDLVDYDTRNFKANVAGHYKLTDKIELIGASSFSYGTTVYQGENRYSLKDILFFQNRIEIRQENKFFLRAYATNEDAGNSYDAVFTAFQIQNNSMPLNDWYVRYLNLWTSMYKTPIQPNSGQSIFPGYPWAANGPYNEYQASSVLYHNHDQLINFHQIVRDSVNQGFNNFSPYFLPGTEEFDTAFAGVTSRPLGQGGSRLIDRSALYHIHGEYKFNIGSLDFVTGANGRLYAPNSAGTIFRDTGDVVIRNVEGGAYLGVEKRFEKFRINGTIRGDKNQNFRFLVSPAASFVYSPTKEHSIRISAASAIRNPTLADQYLFYDVGRAILIGNLTGYDSLITVESFTDYLSKQQKDSLVYFNVAPVQPEQVRTLEVGYRGTLFKKVYVDLSYYYSWYTNFIGFNLGVDASFNQFTPLPFDVQAYRVAANSRDMVTTQGFSAQINYYFHKYLSFNGNYTWNRLDLRDSDDPLIPAFNTPEHKFNVGFSGRDIKMKLGKLKLENWGFNINYKWIQGFLFEGSPQFTGFVDDYYMLDAQVNYRVEKIKSTFKLGAQNLTNNKVFQVYGGPAVGRLAYFSILFDLDKK
jgi:outer membrane receptor protein involved in Fe transport